MVAQEQPRGFAHTGITVPDIEAAFEWYQDVLGFQPLMEPMEVQRNEGHFGELADDLYSNAEFESMKMAQLTSGNQVGLELFEFDTTEDENAPADPTTPGPFHICVVDNDIEELVHRIEEHGGEQHSDIWTIFPDQDYRLGYCTDPQGNFIEIYSHSHERIYSNQDS